MFNVFGIRTYFKCKTLAQELCGRPHQAGARVVLMGMCGGSLVPWMEPTTTLAQEL